MLRHSPQHDARISSRCAILKFVGVCESIKHDVQPVSRDESNHEYVVEAFQKVAVERVQWSALMRPAKVLDGVLVESVYSRDRKMFRLLIPCYQSLEASRLETFRLVGPLRITRPLLPPDLG